GDSLTSNAEMIGKQVAWKIQEEQGVETRQGIVQSVRFQNGSVRFEMKDGTVIGKDQIVSVGIPDPDEGVAQS
ncbi:MAG TPA: hypothetical protein VFK27_04545, partial [Bacillales bacterium]|nr:hypothetical protein [Bacillales bacterium]